MLRRNKSEAVSHANAELTLANFPSNLPSWQRNQTLNQPPRRRVGKQESDSLRASAPLRLKSSSLLDTRVIYCGDNLEQLAKLPDACVDFIYINPPFNSNRNYEVFWGETRETELWQIGGAVYPAKVLGYFQRSRSHRLPRHGQTPARLSGTKIQHPSHKFRSARRETVQPGRSRAPPLENPRTGIC